MALDQSARYSTPRLAVAVAALFMWLLAGCAAPAQSHQDQTRAERTDRVDSSLQWRPVPAASLDPPRVREEFRGLWVATVDNIDWPSTPGAPASEQIEEIDDVLERAQIAGFNAIFFQVRPTADALYRSRIEPASAFVSGRQGRDPGYDPLAEWVRRAHARGIELHAWFNPFRTRHHRSIGPDAPNHINNARPDATRAFGPYRWADPGDPFARQRCLDVVAEVVRGYDVDGVHLDDYFYPYPLQGHAFDDRLTFERYRSGGGRLDRDDWRRANINALVQELQVHVRSLDPSLLFTISPFGIWRPGHPRAVRGMDTYELISTDSRRWLREGWVDALMPQLYWPIDPPQQSFTALLAWWNEQNIRGRHVWPGVSLVREAPKYPDWLSREVPRQMEVLRQRDRTGSAMFSARILREQPSFASWLAEGPYAEPAIVPSSPWKPRTRQRSMVSVDARGDRDVLMLRSDAAPLRWIVQQRNPITGWSTSVLPGSAATHDLELTDRAVVVQAVYRGGHRAAAQAFSRESH